MGSHLYIPIDRRRGSGGSAGRLFGERVEEQTLYIF